MNLIATVVVFAIVIYLQGFRIEIPDKPASAHAHSHQHATCSPAKLYLSHTGPPHVRTLSLQFSCTRVISRFVGPRVLFSVSHVSLDRAFVIPVYRIY
ncbi:hypothetical protein B0H21DRAFT_759648 [Amylocystis lapponica]|nr:hypothetical protein B0H21DRAFT_759648 [Amylocystis lapponica]